MLKLQVVAPIVKKDKVFGDYYHEGGRVFEIPIHKVLYTEPLPPTFYQQGIPAYRQAIERGLEIAKTLEPNMER